MDQQEVIALRELEAILSAKTLHFESAVNAERPRTELLQLYKDIKEIREQISLLRINTICA